MAENGSIILAIDRQKFKVLNAGVPGWSLPHHISRYIFDLRNRVPAVSHVVLYIGYNDAWANITSEASLIGHSDMFKTYPRKMPLWMSSRFLLWVISRVELAIGRNIAPTQLNDIAFRDINEKYEVNNLNLKRFRKELDLLLNLFKFDGIKVLMVLQDSNGEFGSLEGENIFNLTREEIRSIAKDNNIEVVDIREITHSQQEYFADIVHMTKMGNTKRAQYLAPIIQSMVE